MKGLGGRYHGGFLVSMADGSAISSATASARRRCIMLSRAMTVSHSDRIGDRERTRNANESRGAHCLIASARLISTVRRRPLGSAPHRFRFASEGMYHASATPQEEGPSVPFRPLRQVRQTSPQASGPVHDVPPRSTHVNADVSILPNGFLRCAVRVGHNPTVRRPVASGLGLVPMAAPDDCVNDIFLPGGRLRLELLTDTAVNAFKESIRLARETRWDSVRSPHVFMGLLSGPTPASATGANACRPISTSSWANSRNCSIRKKVRTRPSGPQPRVSLRQCASSPPRSLQPRGRSPSRQITPMDLLISLLTSPNSIVAECFERIGVTAAKLTELAVMAEHNGSGK